jgi:hypothetical protein
MNLEADYQSPVSFVLILLSLRGGEFIRSADAR